MPFVTPVPRDRRPTRVLMLAVGLVLYGASSGLMVQAGLGVAPWDVLHQGLGRTVGGAVGTWSIVIGALVLLAWIPLRQRPGVGTLVNVVVVGGTLIVLVRLVPVPHAVWLQVVVLVSGVVLNAVATALYIGAAMGPGPRDGLMTGLAARGYSVRVVRTAIEVTVLAAGWLLGGDVGFGTLLYALAIGPLVHLTLPWFRLPPRGAAPVTTTPALAGTPASPSTP